MKKGLVAEAFVAIKASVEKVWEALTKPEIIKQYMFGTEVISDWKLGSSIVWKGVWKEKRYEDKGVILKMEPNYLLELSHFSPLSGLPDMPENYHTLTYELRENGTETIVKLSQNNNENENAKEHSKQMWQKMLDELKKVLEK